MDSFLRGVVAKSAISVSMAQICDPILPAALRTLYTCVLRDAPDAAMACLLEVKSYSTINKKTQSHAA
jgi:hypothetical protein